VDFGGVSTSLNAHCGAPPKDGRGSGVETRHALSLQTKYHLIRHPTAEKNYSFQIILAVGCHLLLREEKEFATHTMCYKIHIVCGCFG